MSIDPDVKNNFDFVIEQIKNSDTGIMNCVSDDIKLQFYGLYKQAMIGRCNTTRPWSFYVTNCAKWDAWNTLGDMTHEDAMLNYCDLYTKIIMNNKHL